MVDSLPSPRWRNGFLETENFGIRKKPILNREYLTFLCWQIDVYGEYFPEYVLENIPLSGIPNQPAQPVNFGTVLTESTTDLFKNSLLTRSIVITLSSD